MRVHPGMLQAREGMYQVPESVNIHHVSSAVQTRCFSYLRKSSSHHSLTAYKEDTSLKRGVTIFQPLQNSHFSQSPSIGGQLLKYRTQSLRILQKDKYYHLQLYEEKQENTYCILTPYLIEDIIIGALKFMCSFNIHNYKNILKPFYLREN